MSGNRRAKARLRITAGASLLGAAVVALSLLGMATEAVAADEGEVGVTIRVEIAELDTGGPPDGGGALADTGSDVGAVALAAIASVTLGEVLRTYGRRRADRSARSSDVVTAPSGRAV